MDRERGEGLSPYPDQRAYYQRQVVPELDLSTPGSWLAVGIVCFHLPTRRDEQRGNRFIGQDSPPPHAEPDADAVRQILNDP